LGDSYTIGESVEEGARYPVQAARLLREKGVLCEAPEIIATTGWTTSDLLSAMPQAAPHQSYDLVTLLIGVNDQYRGWSQEQYSREFETLVQRSVRLAGDSASHVIVLSIPDYSVTPFARNSNKALIAAQIDSFNIINSRISKEHHVRYLDITEESRKAASDPSLVASDGLHFSGKEYAVWAAMIAASELDAHGHDQ
jgi:lysophospholipase L1-like esterase